MSEIEVSNCARRRTLQPKEVGPIGLSVQVGGNQCPFFETTHLYPGKLTNASFLNPGDGSVVCQQPNCIRRTDRSSYTI